MTKATQLKAAILIACSSILELVLTCSEMRSAGAGQSPQSKITIVQLTRSFCLKVKSQNLATLKQSRNSLRPLSVWATVDRVYCRICAIAIESWQRGTIHILWLMFYQFRQCQHQHQHQYQQRLYLKILSSHLVKLKFLTRHR